MKENSDTVSEPTENSLPCWVTSYDHVAQPLVDRNMVFLFEKGQTDLSTAEKSLLRKWLNRRNTAVDSVRVHIGGAFETSRMGRMRRLSSLVHCLAKYGIQRRCLQLDLDWTLPTRVGNTRQLPSDMVWIQIR
jgi:hypothetical protein